jgi:hypothetical protein
VRKRLVPGLAQNVAAIAAEDHLGHAVHISHAPAGVVGDESFQHALEVIGGFLLVADVARDAPGVDELAILPEHVRGDAHRLERAVLRAHARRLVAQRVAARQAVEYPADHVAIRVEVGDVAADVFLGGVAEELQLGPVGAQDDAVRAHPVERKRCVLKKIGEVAFAFRERGSDGTGHGPGRL